MNEADAKIKKALAELGLTPQPTLTDEEELLLQRALDADLDFELSVKEIFDTDK